MLELPGVRKQNIKVSVYGNLLEVRGTDLERKYHRVIQISPETDIETGKSIYENGILEVTFKKKEEQDNPKGMQINIE